MSEIDGQGVEEEARVLSEGDLLEKLGKIRDWLPRYWEVNKEVYPGGSGVSDNL